MVESNGLNLWWMYEMVDDRERMSECKTLTTDRERLEWDVKKWKNEIDRVMKQVGLNRWKNDMEHKTTLECTTGKRKAQCMNVGMMVVLVVISFSKPGHSVWM